jgi:hypothetical protein
MKAALNRGLITALGIALFTLLQGCVVGGGGGYYEGGGGVDVSYDADYYEPYGYEYGGLGRRAAVTNVPMEEEELRLLTARLRHRAPCLRFPAVRARAEYSSSLHGARSRSAPGALVRGAPAQG